MRTLTIHVGDQVYNQLIKVAKNRNVAVSAYAALIWEAAYSARCGQEGDEDMDAQIARVLVMHASKHDTRTIAKGLNIPESTVDRILQVLAGRGGEENGGMKVNMDGFAGAVGECAIVPAPAVPSSVQGLPPPPAPREAGKEDRMKQITLAILVSPMGTPKPEGIFAMVDGHVLGAVNMDHIRAILARCDELQAVYEAKGTKS